MPKGNQKGGKKHKRNKNQNFEAKELRKADPKEDQVYAKITKCKGNCRFDQNIANNTGARASQRIPPLLWMVFASAPARKCLHLPQRVDAHHRKMFFVADVTNVQDDVLGYVPSTRILPECPTEDALGYDVSKLRA